MTELVAVQKDFALFNVRGKGVVVNTVAMNASDPEPLTAALARGGWVDTSVKPLPVWIELAEAAVGDIGIVASADREVRVPQKVQDAAARALRAKVKSPKISSDPQVRVALKAAQKLTTGTVQLSTVKRIHQFFTTTDAGTKPLTAGGGALTASGLLWLAWGGDPGRDWAAKTAASALVAAGEVPADTDLPDPTAPHDFVPDVKDPQLCVVCGMPEADEIHVVAPVDEAAEAPTAEYFGIFDPEFNGPTFKISQVLAKDTGGAWWVREQGDWSPTEAPTDGAELTMLDEESLVAAISQLDKPGATVAELSISEERLHQLAMDELDMDMLDAVFRLAPYVPPAVRSANASKQLRDSNGRFFKPGSEVAIPSGGTGKVKGQLDDGSIEVEKPDGTVENVQPTDVQVADEPIDAPAPEAAPTAEVPGQKARLDAPGELVPDIAARLDEYLDGPGGEGAEPAPDGDEPVVASGVISLETFRKLSGLLAAGDSMLIPPPDAPASTPSNSPSPAGPAPGPATAGTDAAGGASVPDGEDGTAAVEASSKPPLYLAVVDKNDTAAVMDTYAIIPASEGQALEGFRREDGKWIADSSVVADLKGATPPPVVELDDAKLSMVLGQMDPAADAAPEDAAPAADAPAAAPDTTAMPVAAAGYSTIQKFVIENGALVATGAPGPVLLRPYGATMPEDIAFALDQLAEGGADQNRGGAEKLRRYWTKGEGAAKIAWGTPGDYNRCVGHLSKYLGERAHGYCQLRHKDATGMYTGDHRNEHATDEPDTSLPTFAEFVAGMYGEEPATHEFVDGGEGRCALCGLAGDDEVHGGDPIIEGAPDADLPPLDTEHPDEADDAEADEILNAEGGEEEETGDGNGNGNVVVVNVPGEGEEAEPEPHEFNGPGPESDLFDGVCAECGKSISDPIHTMLASGELGVDGEPETTAEVEQGQKFKIPLVVPEGQESGDGRTFAAESLSSRDVPLALMWQPEGDDGHKGSVIVGRIDHVERIEGGLGNAFGVFDTGKHAQEALRLVRGGMLRGISADLDEFEADVVGGGEDENKITSTKLMVSSGRLMGVTLVAKPAFANCTIELVNEGESEMDGDYEAETGEARVAALLASAAPVHPPRAWFDDPKLDRPTHLTVDDEGRVFGHIAAWDVDHIGLPFGTRPPRSASNYAYFRTGMLRTQEGEDVPVGQLTLAGGHASLQADAKAAVKHYDDTASAWADVAAGEDQFGIWVSGALRPSVTPEQIRIARASSPSGDWRPIKGSLELVAACSVNVPGFPVARARVASGVVYALTAAGALTLERQAPHVPDDPTTLALRIEALEAAERQRLHERALAIRERVSPVMQARQDALIASANAARERVQAHRAVLIEQRDALRARVAAGGLHVMPEFEEHKHPRDGEGKFRQVLARLHDALSGHVGEGGEGGAAGAGMSKLEDAARLEDEGDTEGANRAASEAGDALKSAAHDAAAPVKGALEIAANAVHDAVTNPDDIAATDEEVHIDDIPSPIKEMLIEAVDHMEKNLNPADPDELMSKAKGFITGTNALSPSEVLDLIKQNIKDTANPDAPNILPAAPKLPSAKPTVAIGG